MLKPFYVYSLLLFFVCYYSSAQGEIDDEKNGSFLNENSIGFSLNTNGFGVDYRYGRRINYTERKLYETHLDIIKHPKEVKITNPLLFNSPKFVFGKLNSLTSLKFGYGYQKELFHKVDKGGISIKYFYSYGPSLGFVKTIYYRIYDYADSTLKEETFNSTKHSENTIISRVPFYEHFFDIKIIPGLFAQGGFHFEYDKTETFIHALEVGGGIELFSKKIAIMDTEGQRLFVHLFARYRFGKTIDPVAKKRKKELKNYQRRY